MIIKILLSLFIFLSFTLPAHALNFHMVEPYQTKHELILSTANNADIFLSEYFHTSIEKDVYIKTVNSFREYKKVLENYHVENAETVSRNSYAVTSSSNGILINLYRISDHKLKFVIYHEIVHQYQFHLYGKEWCYSHIADIEKEADIIASKIIKTKPS